MSAAASRAASWIWPQYPHARTEASTYAGGYLRSRPTRRPVRTTCWTVTPVRGVRPASPSRPGTHPAGPATGSPALRSRGAMASRSGAGAGPARRMGSAPRDSGLGESAPAKRGREARLSAPGAARRPAGRHGRGRLDASPRGFGPALRMLGIGERRAAALRPCLGTVHAFSLAGRVPLPRVAGSSEHRAPGPRRPRPVGSSRRRTGGRGGVRPFPEKSESETGRPRMQPARRAVST